MSTLRDDVLERLARDLGAPAPPLVPGDRYAPLELVGRGAMGEVWRARDAALERDVALKVCGDARDADRARARFEREAKVAARLEHPAIPPVHDRGDLADGRPYYVMRLLPGETLTRAAARIASRNERLRLFLKLCEAVAHAHRHGVLHRDLKPDNVMVGPSGEVYVTDWGLARPFGPGAPDEGEAEAGEAGATSPAGTEGYMAPEQREGGALDARADVFALGGVLAFLIAAGDGAGTEKAAPPLAAIAARSRALRKEDRYPDAAALGRDVARHLDREPVEAYRERPLERLLRTLDRHRVLVGLVVAYLLLRAAVFAFFRT